MIPFPIIILCGSVVTALVVGVYMTLTSERQKKHTTQPCHVYEIEMPVISASKFRTPQLEAGNTLCKSQESVYYSLPNSAAPSPEQLAAIRSSCSTYVHFSSPITPIYENCNYIEYFGPEARVD